MEFKAWLIKRKYSLRKWLWITITIFLVLLGSGLGFFLTETHFYKNKILLGVKVGEVDLGGKTIKQAKILLQAEVDYLAEQGVWLKYKQDSYNLKPIVSLEKNGQAYELWFYDIESTVDKAYNYGRLLDRSEKIKQRIRAWLSGAQIEPELKINSEKITGILQAYFNKYEQPAEEAKLVWQRNKFLVKAEKEGRVFDYDEVLNELRQSLFFMGGRERYINLELKVKWPRLVRQEVESLKAEADKRLALSPLVLKFELPEFYQGRDQIKFKKWKINKLELAKWLKIKKDQSQSELYIGLDLTLVKGYLKKIAKQIDRSAKDAKFMIKDGRVVEWQSSQDGFRLDIERTFKRMEEVVRKNLKQEIDLVLNVDRSKITNENVNDLGIRELIGYGVSNFSGSPSNRRHNIKLGADALNGLLIKPDEEFSLLKALGEINAENGYLPELVIKEGRTVPEYGGGLCQIGTTLFRAVINSGLPITQRRNHSYRVSYYEPAGTDATIYDPWPDFKFINDTANYLLLQTRIESDQAIFEFWGTSDGRQVSTTTPVIYNIVPPGKPEYIETTELAPGEKKKVETAHPGADAYFKRIISWPEESGEEVKEEIWRSHYIPWREKWLVGVEKATTTQAEVNKE